MVNNETLKAKLRKELSKLKLSEEKEDVLVKEINYLSNLLIDVYIWKTRDETGGETNFLASNK